MSIFASGLDKNRANYESLSPVSFLKRTAEIYPEYVAIAYHDLRRTYREMLDRCERFSAFLDQNGAGPGDVVSVMLPNIPEMVEMHFSAIAGGRVLHTINTRLDALAIRIQLEHAESKVLVYDREYTEVVRAALAGMDAPPLAIEVVDSSMRYDAAPLGHIDYEAALQEASAMGEVGQLQGPSDEWHAIAVSYTSGTTGNPKGVVTHHRGAYLNAMANMVAWAMPHHPTYIWVLPMFHCNGWCFSWTVTLLAGTHVCLRKVDSAEIFRLANVHEASHLCAAPVVLWMLANAGDDALAFARPINILTAGSAPAASVIRAVEARNAHITQVYGLTETYAPTVVNAWKAPWDTDPHADRYHLKARTGVRFPACEALEIVDDELQSVPWDGNTIGEVVVRGNTVMRGYLKNKTATEEAFRGGWFHTGDLAVRDPDGYISIRDRTKDMINSGGEKISSIEVEEVLFSHPSILEVAVVAGPDPRWGEAPWAFINVKPGHTLTEEDVVLYCRAKLAKFKVPKRVIFTTLERTETGKVQKFKLREFARSAAAETSRD
jgi:fatty-acyl-CoA synthase